MTRLLFAALTLMIWSPLVWSAEDGPEAAEDPNYPKDPAKLVRVKWDAVIEVLRNKDLDEKKKAENIDKIVSPAFDFPLMGKLALGRKHWPRLTESQQNQYVKLFTQRLKESYREKISLYTDETIKHKEAVKKPNGTVHVPMEMMSGEKKLSMVYKLRKTEKRWKIYDVSIQKVSILLTYRSQFNDILRRGTVQDLFERLEEPVSEPDSK